MREYKKKDAKTEISQDDERTKGEKEATIYATITLIYTNRVTSYSRWSFLIKLALSFKANDPKKCFCNHQYSKQVLDLEQLDTCGAGPRQIRP
jgi:hypothetical protein